MNFTQEIKRELLLSLPQKECCKRAFFCSLFDVSGSVDFRRAEFISESERLAECFFSLSESYGLHPEMDGAAYDPRSKKDRMRFVLGQEGAARAYEMYRKERIAEYGDCCALAYLKGAFLGGGSCVVPHEGGNSGYHLEFVFSDGTRAEEFLRLLAGRELLAKAVRRGEREVVYLKSREAISDFLSTVGAEGALSRLEKLSMAREASNFINRVENCMAGNADKSMTASAAQARRIESLKAREEFSLLSDPLKELAEARLKNPTLSLQELAGKLGLSKSCLNHRMRKLMEICEKTEEKL